MSVTFKCDDGDLMINFAGRFILVYGIEKSAQDMGESLLNNWDPSTENTFNGSELYLIDEDPSTLDNITAEERIRVAIEEAITRLMQMQQADNWVDEDEQIESIRELFVQKLGSFTYGFFLRCITLSDQEVPMGFAITLRQMLPDSFDLQSLLPELRGGSENSYDIL